MTKAFTCTALVSLALTLILIPGTVLAQADTGCGPATTRLSSVTTDLTNGTITGSPVGGGAPVTLVGELSAYQKSEGFGDSPSAAIQNWDETLDRLNEPRPVDDPEWYGRGKGQVFASRELNRQAAAFPSGTLIVEYGPGSQGRCSLTSIRPAAR